MEPRDHEIRTDRAGRVLTFCLGGTAGIVLSVGLRGLTVLTEIPLLWAWGLVAAIAGSGAADSNHWLLYVIAGAMHGCAFLLLAVVVQRIAESRLGVGHSRVVSIGVTLTIYIAALLIPSGRD
jgi:hypothetical protein